MNRVDLLPYLIHGAEFPAHVAVVLSIHKRVVRSVSLR